MTWVRALYQSSTVPSQTISFLGVLRTMGGTRNPHLVICPASLIQNWAREFKHW